MSIAPSLTSNSSICTSNALSEEIYKVNKGSQCVPVHENFHAQKMQCIYIKPLSTSIEMQGSLTMFLHRAEFFFLAPEFLDLLHCIILCFISSPNVLIFDQNTISLKAEKRGLRYTCILTTGRNPTFLGVIHPDNIVVSSLRLPHVQPTQRKYVSNYYIYIYIYIYIYQKSFNTHRPQNIYAYVA